jgi:hypothetical protein
MRGSEVIGINGSSSTAIVIDDDENNITFTAPQK